jgi:predicted nucleic acid-binding protein
VKAFFDTNVLIAAFQGGHPHHQASVKRFAEFKPETACCGAHSLAEVYSSLTRMPLKQRVPADTAMLFVGNIVERLSIISLSAEEYVQGVQSAANLGIVGGNIYDAMLAHCAIKSGAEIIYTWNTKHYAKCGPEVIQRLRTP